MTGFSDFGFSVAWGSRWVRSREEDREWREDTVGRSLVRRVIVFLLSLISRFLLESWPVFRIHRLRLACD